MIDDFTIAANTVHLWLAELLDHTADEQALLALLNPEEVARAVRLHSEVHKRRFIISRGLLRKTLSLYTGIAPDQISFQYGAHGKPYLQGSALALQFNISHSADVAVFAITMQHEIGVDIEKVEPYFRENIAKRFFSEREYSYLMSLTENARIKGFFQVWSRKEAIIKAAGQGVFVPLSDFSLDIAESKETIELVNDQQKINYYVENIYVPDEYQAAVATTVPMEHIIYKRVVAA